MNALFARLRSPDLCYRSGAMFSGALKDKTITTTSADGLNVSTQRDIDGNGTIDRTIADVTVVNADDSCTETITQKNGNASLRSKTVVSTSAGRLNPGNGAERRADDRHVTSARR